MSVGSGPGSRTPPPPRWWSPSDDGLTVFVRVTPGARTTEIIDASGDRLRIRVRAPAHDGKANDELRRFLADRFGVRRSAVSFVRGERSREKTLHVAGIAEPTGEVAGEP